MSGLGFEVYARLRRLGANAATVHTCPADRVQDVIDTAALLGIHLVAHTGEDPDPALYFREDDFDDDHMGWVADQLTRAGVGTYAYALSHGDVMGAHIDVITRRGTNYPLIGNRVLFVESTRKDDDQTGSTTMVTGVLGAPDDLAGALPFLQERFVVEECYGPDGSHASLFMTHEEVAAGISEPHEVFEEVTKLLETAGFTPCAVLMRA